MRKTMNISVSERMHKLILRRARDGNHSSVSEYIRSLVRADQMKMWGETDAIRFVARTANDCLLDDADSTDSDL